MATQEREQPYKIGFSGSGASKITYEILQENLVSECLRISDIWISILNCSGFKSIYLITHANIVSRLCIQVHLQYVGRTQKNSIHSKVDHHACECTMMNTCIYVCMDIIVMPDHCVTRGVIIHRYWGYIVG